jgi:hypothetical protein
MCPPRCGEVASGEQPNPGDSRADEPFHEVILPVGCDRLPVAAAFTASARHRALAGSPSATRPPTPWRPATSRELRAVDPGPVR